MTDFALLSFIISLTYLAVTVVLAMALLRWFDWTLGLSFKKDVWEKIHEDPIALALYHGLRVVAVFYLGAAFVT